jgi:predicted  nucleic acid-binding Zn-ribbon protein
MHTFVRLRRIADQSRAVFVVPALVLTAGLGACASNETRPERELVLAEAGIDQARQAGAAQHGSAELGAAQDKLNQARVAAERDEMPTARRLAQQAALDAELAAAKARNRKAEISVQELNDTIEALREEIERNQSRGITQ